MLEEKITQETQTKYLVARRDHIHQHEPILEQGARIEYLHENNGKHTRHRYKYLLSITQITVRDIEILYREITKFEQNLKR